LDTANASADVIRPSPLVSYCKSGVIFLTAICKTRSANA
jgi:hypothetical protein